MPAKVIAVTGYKGGVGKTTISFHLAEYFKYKGRCVLIDGDANRASLAWYERGHGRFAFTTISEKAAAKFMGEASHVIIDTPARPRSKDLQDIAEGADLVILPCAPSSLDLLAMIETANDLKGAKYRALISIVPPLPSHEGEKMREDLKASGIPVFETMIRRSSIFVKVATLGKTAEHYNNKQARDAWGDFIGLGMEIEKLIL
jgi:chromosome partitioning protein